MRPTNSHQERRAIAANDALLAAAQAGDAITTKMLVSSGMDVNARKEDGTAAVSVASTAEIVSVLGSYGLDPSSVASRRAVIDAVSNGRLELLRALVETRANVNVADDNHLTPVGKAKNHSSLAALINHGLDKTSAASRRALTVAVKDGQADLVSAFGQAGFDVNAADDEHHTPVTLASDANNVPVLKALISNGLDGGSPSSIRAAAAAHDAKKSGSHSSCYHAFSQVRGHFASQRRVTRRSKCGILAVAVACRRFAVRTLPTVAEALLSWAMVFAHCLPHSERSR